MKNLVSIIIAIVILLEGHISIIYTKETIVDIPNKITIFSPKPNDIVSSPLIISGKARGFWFFQGCFLVQIYDANGKSLGEAQAKFIPKFEGEEWMTTDFVNFRAELKFTKSSTETGYLIFKKNNPSDRRELDGSFKLLIQFQMYDIFKWKTFQNIDYGFEIKYPEEWQKPIEHKRPYPAEGVLSLIDVEFNKDSSGQIGFNISVCKKNSSGLDYSLIDRGFGLSLKPNIVDMKDCRKPTTNVLVGVENYSAKEVYVPPGDRCFHEAYFYFLHKGEYDYFIIPNPRGEGYIGYDGKLQVEKNLREFQSILSTFKFINNTK